MRIGLGLSIPELATRGGKFSPASLFAGGVQGVWYSPDDYSTLFQDSAGTTAVTAVEQPVGLMLDKSQGLVLGSNLVGSSISNASWENLPGTPASTVSGNQLTFGGQFSGRRWQVGSTVAGARYEFKFTARRISGNTALSFFHENSASGNQTTLTITDTAAEYSCRVLGNASGGLVSFGWQDRNASGQGTIEITNVSVREIPGNHASQATSTSRPVLRARYNLLTYSEQFDNAAWIKGPTQTTTNTTATTAPDGTTTADLFKDNSSGGTGSLVVYQNITLVSNQTCTFSVYLKNASLTQYAALRTFNFDAGANGYTYVDIVNGTIVSTAPQHISSVQNVGNGWYRFQVTVTLGADNAGSFAVYPSQDGTTITVDLDGTSGLYIWGADLRTGSSAGTYQRIAAATDYATAGFLPYLAFDGSDDSFGTNSINFSATDKMSVCAGVTESAAVGTAVAVELSASYSANNGTFALLLPGSAADTNLTFYSKGTTAAASVVPFGTAPVTGVITNLGNITAPSVNSRVNGVAGTPNTATQGTGNYGNHPLFIGRRNNTNFPFNGRIYGLIVAGKALSASELSATESWMATKTGVTI